MNISITKKIAPAILVLINTSTVFANNTNTEPTGDDVIVSICDDSGYCTDLPEEAGIVLSIIKALFKELNSGNPIGENNEIRRAISELDKFLKYGIGKNNDIHTFLDQQGITELLKKLGIQLF